MKMANTISLMTNAVRGVVSKKRIRYQENGYDLDLAYVCPNLIAMGYPAENIESIFRNKIDHVCHFFEEKHKDRYKIYNLCSERNYDSSKFHGRVAVYPFDDHNPPPIRLIKEFCDDVDAWLKADRNNVAAVHCKAGKGRTGTMICCYLLHCHMKTTAEDALTYYDEKRTKNKKGVTIPSQRRYVEYYAKLVNSGQPYEDRTLQICEIRFSQPLSNQDNVYCNIWPNPRNRETESNPITKNFRRTQTLEINDHCIPLTGDVKIEVYRKVMKKREKYFHFWFNTFFICDSAAYDEGSDKKLVYELSKYELDDAHKDTEHKTVPQDFKVQLVFKPVPRHQTTLNDNCHLQNNHITSGQNHCNQLSNNLHNSSINSPQTMLTNNQIGPKATVSLLSSSGERTPIDMNCQNQQQAKSPEQQKQQLLHKNQIRYQQPQGNSVVNSTKRRTQQNNDNQHSNGREPFSSSSSSSNLVVGRTDESRLSSVGNAAVGTAATAGAVSKTTTQMGSSNREKVAVAGLHTPSVSSDVSRTNSSSSRSSSINSEVASSNGGDADEDWESEPFQANRRDDDNNKRGAYRLTRSNYSDNYLLMTTSMHRHLSIRPPPPPSKSPSPQPPPPARLSSASPFSNNHENLIDGKSSRNGVMLINRLISFSGRNRQRRSNDRDDSNVGNHNNVDIDDDDDDDDDVNDNSNGILRNLISPSPSAPLISNSSNLQETRKSSNHSSSSGSRRFFIGSPSARRKSNLPLSFGLKSMLTRSFCRRSRHEST